MHRARWLVALAALAAGAAQAEGVEKLYVIDCGWAHAPDQSRWSPGVNVGVPIDVSDNCYLVRHAKGWLLWDTGYPDAVADKAEGVLNPANGLTAHRTTTLAAQLARLGVKPADVTYVAVSHTHPDHVGNVDLFPTVPVLMQRAEYEWAFAQEKKPFRADHPVMKLEGDKDVFGDRSVVIFSTPGHTPGHQSLLVKLPKTGAVVLSGDAVHFRSNWDARRVPGINTDKQKTLASMDRVADVLKEKRAQLWINHDKPQSDRQRHAPDAYE
jgi:glyoxylase-like metal-dependent hydrolase (beta-lactamase superfamily II)